mgnify:CR=1 FL=1
MHRALLFVVAAVVSVALLSTGANALVERTASGYGTAACGSAELSAYPAADERGDEVTVAYEDLTDRERRAVDRARTRTNRTAGIDPTIVEDFPDAVVVNGTRYRINTQTSGCPLIAGLPGWTDGPLLLFLGLYQTLSPLYLPGGVVVGLLVASDYVGDWLRFG